MADYIFPNIMAKVMSKISQRTQYESSMLSMTFILCGLMFGAVYTVFFTQASTIVKVMVGSNAIAAFIFLSSSLVTQYQQYRSYMDAIEFYEHTDEIVGGK